MRDRHSVRSLRGVCSHRSVSTGRADVARGPGGEREGHARGLLPLRFLDNGPVIFAVLRADIVGTGNEWGAMLVATFRPTTDWAGRSIDFANGQFLLEEHGQISAADVLRYDSEGHLRWATNEMREWVQSQAAPPVPPRTMTAQPTPAPPTEAPVPPQTATAQQTPPPPATPDRSQTMTLQPTTLDYEQFYEQIAMTSVADTVAELLTHPYGFHGDTGIRDALYARLKANGGAKLRFDDPRAGFSTLLLQSEQYTQAQYIGSGKAPRGARFDLALTAPPKASDPIEDRYAEKLSALFAFELGKNKASAKVIDPDILDHAADATPGTSDVSKLYRELVHHDLRQGWAIEFFDSRGGNGAATISSTLDLCKELAVPEGKKLVVVFVGFSTDGKHLVSSNDTEVQAALIGRLAELGIQAGPEQVKPVPKPPRRRGSFDGGGSNWDRAWERSDTVEGVFEGRAAFAERIIRIGGMEGLERKMGYVNLSCPGKKNIGQIHPMLDGSGIGLVLKRRGDRLPATCLSEIPLASLKGHKGANKLWLDGHPRYNKQGPAVAFLISDEVADLGDDDREWQDIVRLLKYAKTL